MQIPAFSMRARGKYMFAASISALSCADPAKSFTLACPFSVPSALLRWMRSGAGQPD
jgi:hypothetical protein